MYDLDRHRTIDRLIECAGSKERCLELGFLVQDDNSTLHLSPAGLGYLIDIVATDIKTLPAVYAAGYNQALAQTSFEIQQQ